MASFEIYRTLAFASVTLLLCFGRNFFLFFFLRLMREMSVTAVADLSSDSTSVPAQFHASLFCCSRKLLF